MTQSLILAIDQGGQSSRVAIYTQSGEQLYCFSAACETTREFVNGAEHIEQNPQEILRGIKDCIDKIKLVLGDDVKNIIAAGFAGQGSSLLCWDNKTGEALSPVLSWQDIRGDKLLKNISLTHQQAQQLTGLRVSAHYGASKIRWCLDNNAQVIQARNNNSLSVGPIVSYILWHLCGTQLVDPGHAQRTLLWNLQKNDWDESLLELFNIPRSLLPKCKFHNSAFGNFMLGDHKIPFTACARDQGASLFAQGLPDKNECYINIGTGAFIQRVSGLLIAPDGLLVSPLWLPRESYANENIIELASPICYAAELANEIKPASHSSLYAWEATVNGAASALSFIKQETGLDINPNTINHALALNPIRDCYFLNAVGGLSAPYWRTDLISQFSPRISAHEKLLAWLESIIFQIAVNVKLMNQENSAQKIYISGGLSNADGICQKIADITQLPVYRSENADATLQGIACMAIGIPAEWTSSNFAKLFHSRSDEHLQKRFMRWQKAMSEWLG
jgi:glycerol kinase